MATKIDDAVYRMCLNRPILFMLLPYGLGATDDFKEYIDERLLKLMSKEELDYVKRDADFIRQQQEILKDNSENAARNGANGGKTRANNARGGRKPLKDSKPSQPPLDHPCVSDSARETIRSSSSSNQVNPVSGGFSENLSDADRERQNRGPYDSILKFVREEREKAVKGEELDTEDIAAHVAFQVAGRRDRLSRDHEVRVQRSNISKLGASRYLLEVEQFFDGQRTKGADAKARDAAACLQSRMNDAITEKTGDAE